VRALGKSGSRPLAIKRLIKSPAIMNNAEQRPGDKVDYTLLGIMTGLIIDAVYSIFLVNYWPLRFLGFKTTYDSVVHHEYIILPGFGEVIPELASFAGLAFPLFCGLFCRLLAEKKRIELFHRTDVWIITSVGAGISFLVCCCCFLMLFGM